MLFHTPTLSSQELEVHAQIDELRSKLSYAVASRVWTGFLRRVMFARAIQSSNSIEGYNVTVEDAIAAAEGELPLDAEVVAWQAVTGYRDAMTYVLRLADDPHFVYEVSLIRGLHNTMMKHELTKNPGRWRQGPISVIRSPGNEKVYDGPDADLVPELVDEFVTQLRLESADPPMVRAAMSHLNLVMIHPFSDGNGRMARCIQTLVLARDRILAPEFCSIEEYLGRETPEYYAVLGEVGAGAWHPERDALPWVRFCLKAHYRQAMTLLRRSRELARLWTALEELTHSLRLPERMIAPLADAALGFKVRNATYRTHDGEITDTMASKDLLRMSTAGLIVAHSRKRGRYYTAAPILLDIRDRIREPKPKLEDPFGPPKRSKVGVSGAQQRLPGLWLDEDT